MRIFTASKPFNFSGTWIAYVYVDDEHYCFCQIRGQSEEEVIAKTEEFLSAMKSKDALDGLMASLRKVRDEFPDEWDALLRTEGASGLLDAWDKVKAVETNAR